MGKSEYGGGGGGGSGSGSAGKIFVGGLPRDTTLATFQKHFGAYGEIVDSVIMKNKHTSQPRGFGFITYSDPAVVDKVMEDDHVINGKQVEIKRTIPKDSMQSKPKDFRTKKIFVGGLPPTLTEDDFKEFFENFGAVVEHQIMHDHQTRRSRGFGFVVFDSEQVVDELLAKGNMIDLAGSKVEIKKAEPKKSTNPPPSAGSDSRSAYGRDSRDRPSREDVGVGLAGAYSSYGSGFGPYRNQASFAGSLGNGGVGDYHGRYGRYYPGIGSYEGSMSSFGYPSRFGPYGGGFDRPYAGGNLSAYGRGGDESFGGPGSSSYGAAMYAGAYDPALGAYGPGGAPDMNRGSYGSGRYHPYG